MKHKIHSPAIRMGFIILVGWILMSGTTLQCEEFSASVKKTVERAIDIRQGTQKSRDQWEAERQQLTAEYEMLQTQNTRLQKTRDRLMAEKKALKNRIESLETRKMKTREISEEMAPFLETVFGRIKTIIETDLPFLEVERRARIAMLRKNLDDPDLPVSEKFRNVMEVLFIEAEYGGTIEVYQDKVTIGNRDVLANIFRLGRVSLFFQTLDRKTSGYFNMAESGWQVLPERYNRDISAALEMGAKHRPVDILSLPLGRIEVP